MHILLILISILFSYSVLAGTEIIDTMGRYKTKEFTFTDNSKYINYQVLGQWSNNLGHYGSFECLGNMNKLSNGEMDKLNVICEFTNQHGIKIWREFNRSGNLLEAGVGISKIIDSNSPYRKLLIGTTCRYGISRIDDMSFGKSKCELSDDLINKLSN